MSYTVDQINEKSGLKNCYTCLNSSKGSFYWSDTADGGKGMCSATKNDNSFYNKSDSRYTNCDKPNMHSVNTINNSEKLRNCYTCLNSGVTEDGYWWSDNKNMCSTIQTDSTYYNKVSTNTPYTTSSCAKPANSGDASWYDNYNNQLEQNQELVEKLLDDIQQLQDLEKSLLDTLDTNTNLTSDERIAILEKINSISDMRTNLYSALNNINGYYDSLNSATSSSMSDQSSAIKIIEEQLNKTKMSLMDYETDKNNKLRLIEVNSYYSQRYSEHAKIMKILIYTLAPIILLSIISNAGLIPYSVFILLLIIISVYGGVLFFNTLLSIWSRDSINYQQYLWSFNKNSAPTPIVNDGTNSNPWGFPNLGTCVGADCCSSDTYYDTESDTCKKT
jgi:hypothetical protein